MRRVVLCVFCVLCCFVLYCVFSVCCVLCVLWFVCVFSVVLCCIVLCVVMIKGKDGGFMVRSSSEPGSYTVSVYSQRYKLRYDDVIGSLMSS